MVNWESGFHVSAVTARVGWSETGQRQPGQCPRPDAVVPPVASPPNRYYEQVRGV